MTRPGGLLLIDHEASESAWVDNKHLGEYRNLTRLTVGQHLHVLWQSRELFTVDFWRSAFTKLFINPRYQREGDLHVWPDDHIEWQEVRRLFSEHDMRILHELDYLLYQPRGGRAVFERYRDLCADTKCLVARKDVSRGSTGSE